MNTGSDMAGTEGYNTFRGKLFGSIEGYPATCEANTIRLNWWSNDGEMNSQVNVQQSAQSCTYNSTLTIPESQYVPERTGYTFGGWRITENQTSAESQIRD
jgi:hypothetical protein